MGMVIARAWADLGSDQFLKESTESSSKTFRPRKVLIANPCHRHGHGHRWGYGRSRKRSVFKGINGIATQNFSAPKILIANPCRCHGHGHRSGFGPSSQANSFYRDPQNRHPKKSVPKFLDSKSMPPSWAWSSLGFCADLAADRFLLEPAESPSKIFRPRKCLIANPCRCHGHGHRSGLGGACLRTVSIRIRRIALPKKSVPKIFDSQSMPPPWA